VIITSRILSNKVGKYKSIFIFINSKIGYIFNILFVVVFITSGRSGEHTNLTFKFSYSHCKLNFIWSVKLLYAITVYDVIILKIAFNDLNLNYPIMLVLCYYYNTLCLLCLVFFENPLTYP